MAFGICIVLMFFTSVVLYYLHPPKDTVSDGSDFDSLPNTMYLSVMMLTGAAIPSPPLSSPPLPMTNNRTATHCKSIHGLSKFVPNNDTQTDVLNANFVNSVTLPEVMRPGLMKNHTPNRTPMQALPKHLCQT